MKRHLSALLLVLSIQSVSFAQGETKGLYVLITPNGGNVMHCQVGVEASPDGLWRWRVTVEGGKGPYHWRLPLYQQDRGDNQISAAQIGTALLDSKRSFLVEVASEEVVRTGKSTNHGLNLEVSTEQGLRARCLTPLVRNSASVEIVQASVSE